MKFLGTYNSESATMYVRLVWLVKGLWAKLQYVHFFIFSSFVIFIFFLSNGIVAL